MTYFKELFSPFKIKSYELRNRIVMPALASFLFDEEGKATEHAVEHYRRRALGGAAMIIVEASAVSPEGVVSRHQSRIDTDSHIEGLRKIRKAIEAEGAVPALQIFHAGRQTTRRIIKQTPVAPSPLSSAAIRGEIRPLGREEIQKIVKMFGEAAKRAVEAGFKIIEIHGAHGYLVNQFLSSYSNIRTDEYGGGIEGRTRFAEEIVREVRSRIGDDVPISFKISAQEFCPDGIYINESTQIVHRLARAGVDVVQVSAGNDYSPEWICQPQFMHKGCLVKSAEIMKESVEIPVMAVGRINDPFIANQIIQEKKADLVCMGRALLADPDLPNKAREGKTQNICPCIACNTCLQSIFRKGKIDCTVNPVAGREKELFITAAKKKQTILVVGGGPGGMAAASTAAKRGHRVYLYEKAPHLGGLLFLSGLIHHKRELKDFVEYQVTQLHQYGVKYTLEKKVTKDLILEIDPDAIVLATGSVPVYPEVKGIEGTNVSSYLDILQTKSIPLGRTVVVGGGSTGCEIALHMADAGCAVTVIEMLPNMAQGLETINRKVLLKMLNSHGVHMFTNCKLIEINDKGVLIEDAEHRETFLKADQIIIAVGNKPNKRMYREIEDMGYRVYQVGDCVEPRSAREAILEGTRVGMLI